MCLSFSFFFQAEDGIRYLTVTGVQTCALPISETTASSIAPLERAGPGDLSFLASRRYLPYFQQTRAAIVLCKPEFAAEPAGPRCRVGVRDPHVARLARLPLVYPEPVWQPGIRP